MNDESIEIHMGALIDENRDTTRFYESFFTTEDLLRLYREVLLPFDQGRLAHGSFLCDIAEEFNPDALNLVRNVASKWLAGRSLMTAVSNIQDNQYIANGPSIFNAGPYARGCWTQQRTNRIDQQLMEEYVGTTYREVRFTRIP